MKVTRNWLILTSTSKQQLGQIGINTKFINQGIYDENITHSNERRDTVTVAINVARK